MPLQSVINTQHIKQANSLKKHTSCIKKQKRKSSFPEINSSERSMNKATQCCFLSEMPF